MRNISISTALLSLVLAPAVCAAQRIESRDVQPRAIPAAAPYTGNVVAARGWTDALGENLLIVTRTNDVPSRNREVDGLDAETYAYHYVRRGTGYELLWRTTDFIRECREDLTLEVSPETIAITDLDADGTAETTFMYILACRGGMDPCGMKLIMHEGATKYAIRGSTDLSDQLRDEWARSLMSIDPSLADGPAAFLQFAVRHWKRFERESLWFRDDHA